MSEDTAERVNLPTDPRRIFTFLILYRWLSLIPPLVTIFLTRDEILPFPILIIAVSINTLISFFPRKLNRALRAHPWLLIIDLSLMAGLIAFTNGWRSPYYLHALNPLLAAAFFFQLRGALLATTTFLPFYSVGVLAATVLNGQPLDWLAIIIDVVGFYLISSAFGYAFILVSQLRMARDDLVIAHRDLGVIHDLTVSLQNAADVEEVQERVLEAVTINLGFKQAVVGLVDPDRNIITGWLGRVRDGQIHSSGRLPHLIQVPISAQGGPVAEALLEQKIRLTTTGLDTADDWIRVHFGMTRCRIFPMMLREHAVGVLLVDADEGQEDSARLRSLESITHQAAVAIGTTMLCIDRAQRLAVQEERLRIAQDIHDTVSQSLFGIVYTLDGSIQLLPEQPEAAVPELKRALRVAEEAHNEVRHSILNIWPSEVTADRFANGLRKYTADNCQASNLQLTFHISGDFAQLSSQVRRGLYRIAQEALANVAHHAAASQADVSLEVATNLIRLIVTDNGRGFDPEIALAREYNREHFGLRGMQQRVRSLGGAWEIHSQPGDGSKIIVEISNPSPSKHE